MAYVTVEVNRSQGLLLTSIRIVCGKIEALRMRCLGLGGAEKCLCLSFRAQRGITLRGKIGRKERFLVVRRGGLLGMTSPGVFQHPLRGRSDPDWSSRAKAWVLPCNSPSMLRPAEASFAAASRFSNLEPSLRRARIRREAGVCRLRLLSLCRRSRGRSRCVQRTAIALGIGSRLSIRPGGKSRLYLTVAA